MTNPLPQNRPEATAWMLANINLSRYDRKFFADIWSKKIVQNIALTHGQNLLWEKILKKYHRQITGQQTTVDNLLSLTWILPPMELVTQYLKKQVWIQDEKICVQFPFNRKMVDEMQDLKAKETKFQRNDHKEFWVFNHDEKIWYIKLNTKLAAIIYQFARKFQISLDETFQQIVTAMEQVGPRDHWQVQLRESNGRYYVNNINERLCERLNHCDFSIDIPTLNFIQNLGIDPGSHFVEKIQTRYPHILTEFFSKNTAITIDNLDFSPIIDYCQAAGINDILVLSASKAGSRWFDVDLPVNIYNLDWPISVEIFKKVNTELANRPLLLVANGIYARTLADECSMLHIFKSPSNKLITIVDINKDL